MMSEKCWHKNSILVTGLYLNYPDVGSVSNWLKQNIQSEALTSSWY